MAFGHLIDKRKLNKRNHVVDVFRSQGSLSKIRAREACGYSMDTLIGIFDSLEEEGYISLSLPAAPLAASRTTVPEAEGSNAQLKRSKGRPEELYRLNDEREIYLGTTFNRGGIFSALVSFSGATLDLRSDEFPGLGDQGAFEAAVTRHLEAFLAANGSRLPAIRRIGLALPGQLDAERRLLRHYGLMPFLKDVDLGARVRSLLPGIPVVSRHNVAGMARFFLNDRALVRGYGRILFVSARAGAAHALIQDGKLVLDQGEMGHLHVAPPDKVCECGRSGCLDSVFSVAALRELFPGMALAELAAALAEEGAEGGSVLRSRLESAYLAFCEALLDLCAAFSPDLLLLSGELLALLPEPIAWIRTWLGKLIDLDRPPAWFPGEMIYRPTGSEAAAIGLCYALIEEDWAWQPDQSRSPQAE